MSSFYGNGGGSNNGSSGFVATPDWNQNDPNGDGYIANRPFYVAGEINTEIVNNTFNLNNSKMSTAILLDEEKIIGVLKNGMEFTAYYDGTYYSGEIINKDIYYFIGNCSIVPIPGMASGDNIDMPFLFLIMAEGSQAQGGLILKDFYTGEKSISISIKTSDVHKIDSKYLPDSKFDLSDRMAKGISSNGTEVNGAVIEGSLNNIASGVYSHAEGGSTTASGGASHAEGGSTTASNDDSHAEGARTTASGYASHAEGILTEASGDGSHAEGRQTIANGMSSHAEGYHTTASGKYSHAEGSDTIASGEASHAEGQGTTANHMSQHVFGEYNILDDSSKNASNRGNYIEIVGNGTSDNNRSNARTLDWSGNEQLAGSLTLGLGTADESTITAAQLKQLLTLESSVESLLATI